MIVGIPKEIKENENRVSIVPSGVATLVAGGYRVLVEKDAGLGSGFTDKDYEKAGAEVLERSKVYTQCDVLCKVKEIEEEEYNLLRANQIVFSYLHSNANKDMTMFLLDKKITGIAYEDIIDGHGNFPLLAPMSVFAGRGGFISALQYSQSINGGNGKMLFNNTGLEQAHVTIIGAGNSGLAAAEMASLFGNRVSILDISLKALELAREQLGSKVEYLISNRDNLIKCLESSDVLINCILWPKTRKDHLVYREDLKVMKPGSLIVDVSCDEAGAIETSHSTTHDKSIYEVDGIRHYAVDNIPSAYASNASELLSISILPYVLRILKLGVVEALIEDPLFRRGLTTYSGILTLKETADKLGLAYTDPLDALKS